MEMFWTIFGAIVAAYTTIVIGWILLAKIMEHSEARRVMKIARQFMTPLNSPKPTSSQVRQVENQHFYDLLQTTY